MLHTQIHKQMKKLQLILPVALVLLASSCKKNNAVTIPELVATKKHFAPDSSSFTVNGKTYSFGPYGSLSRGTGNRGTNMKLSTKNGDWSISNGRDYWVGAADSVQFYKSYENSLDNAQGSIRFSFIKNYKRASLVYNGILYAPKIESEVITLGDQNYALDYERQGKDEGIAINLSLKELNLTSYSPLRIQIPSSLGVESHRDSKFKILKIEDVKDTDFMRIEAVFEGNLFDKNEKPVKITNGFLRLTVLKYGRVFPS